MQAENAHYSFYGVAFLFIIGCALLSLFVSIESSRSDENHPQYTIPRHIQYSFTIKNTSNKLVTDAELWTYGPVKKTSTQLCQDINASIPSTITTDDLNNQIIHLTLQALPPYASQVITIEADLLLAKQPMVMQTNDLEMYLGPEKYIEIDHPAIINIAKSLSSEKPSKTAEKIFNWVQGNIKYTGFNSKERGALYALKNKKGDCTEFAYLFTALSRANQIPTRNLGGYICPQNKILKPSDYHNWAEFYQKEKWFLVDPQKNVFLEANGTYVAMNIIQHDYHNEMLGYQRFRVKGEGIKVRFN